MEFINENASNIQVYVETWGAWIRMMASALMLALVCFWFGAVVGFLFCLKEKPRVQVLCTGNNCERCVTYEVPRSPLPALNP